MVLETEVISTNSFVGMKYDFPRVNKKSQKREDWLRDVDARQRNVTFPDTAASEARFWRNLIHCKERLTVVQKTGTGLIALCIVSLAVAITFNGNTSITFSWHAVASATSPWLIAFAILGAFLLLFRLSQRLSRK